MCRVLPSFILFFSFEGLFLSMGLFDALFGRKECPMGPEDAENVLRVEELARGLSVGIGEEFSVGRVGDSAGYLSKSAVIGVSYGEAFSRPGMVEVGPNDLVMEESKVIMCDKHAVGSRSRDCSSVDLKIFQKITAYLDSKGIDYHIFINKDQMTPMVIRTDKGNITVAPMISR
jgi:hypothetical protein